MTFEIYAFIYRKFVGHWLDYARAKWGSLVGCCPESSQPFIILNLIKTCQHWWWWVGWELICLWVGDVEICQELMTFMILFGFLPHSLVSVLIRFLNKTNDSCVNSTENGFTKRH